MNRLHIVLTAVAAAAASHAGAARALPTAPLPQGDGILPVQLGNGGPVNGARTSGGPPSVLHPSGANGGAQPAGPAGGAASSGGDALRPRSGAIGGNGSKPAPMGANGVRKVR